MRGAVPQGLWLTATYSSLTALHCVSVRTRRCLYCTWHWMTSRFSFPVSAAAPQVSVSLSVRAAATADGWRTSGFHNSTVKIHQLRSLPSPMTGFHIASLQSTTGSVVKPTYNSFQQDVIIVMKYVTLQNFSARLNLLEKEHSINGQCRTTGS